MRLISEPVDCERFTEMGQRPFDHARDRIVTGPLGDRVLDVLSLSAFTMWRDNETARHLISCLCSETVTHDMQTCVQP